MIKQIKMPSAGQTTDEALVCQWNVKVGDSVKRGDILLETETDKATLPVESFSDGIVIDILHEEGDTVDAGDVLCVIGDAKDLETYKREGAESSAPAPAAAKVDAPAVQPVAEVEEDEYQPIIKGSTPVAQTKPAEKPAEKPAPAKPAVKPQGQPNDNVKAMPNAKLLAREKGVDIRYVTPANGSLVKKSDVLSYIDSCAEDFDSYEVLKLNKKRKITGQRMLLSAQTIPAFHLSIDVDMTNAIALKEGLFKQKDLKISYNDIICLVLAKLSDEFNLLKARYENDEIRIYKHLNIGIAVALEDALVVPVTKGCDVLSLAEIAQNNKKGIKKAKEGVLLPTDMGCGSLSLSNLGMFDVSSFSAIVNPPEGCIFAISSIAVKPVWDGKAFVPRSMCNINVSFDHRIFDGAYSAKMLAKFKAYMENPALLLV
jgi:pyruvate dehydrogenase E2 component (dihydrolipoamide acetyltransferase)